MQPADGLEVHPRGRGADQSLPGRLQRSGSSGVASLLRREGAGGEEEREGLEGGPVVSETILEEEVINGFKMHSSVCNLIVYLTV